MTFCSRTGDLQRIDNNGLTQAAHACRMKANGHTGKDIAKYLGVSRATLYRRTAVAQVPDL